MNNVPAEIAKVQQEASRRIASRGGSRGAKRMGDAGMQRRATQKRRRLLTKQKVAAILPKSFYEGLVEEMAGGNVPKAFRVACPSSLLSLVNGDGEKGPSLTIQEDHLVDVEDEMVAACLCNNGEVEMCLTNTAEVQRYAFWVVMIF